MLNAVKHVVVGTSSVDQSTATNHPATTSTDNINNTYTDTINPHHHHHHRHKNPLIDADAVDSLRVTNRAPIHYTAIEQRVGRLLLTNSIQNTIHLHPNIKTVSIDTVIAGRNKKADDGYIPWSLRTRHSGSTGILIYHMYDKVKYPCIQRNVSNDWLQFQLRPSYLINPDTNEILIYWNAQDPSFYTQSIQSPQYTIWLLIKNTVLSTGGYVKRRLIEHCIANNIQCHMRNPNKFDLTLSNTYSNVTQLIYNGELIDLPDAVIPRVGANVDYFGLAVMRQLEKLNIKIMNSSQSIEISRDKLFTSQVLASYGIPIPRSMLSKLPFDQKFISDYFGYPVIMKEASGSKGEQVWKIDAANEFKQLLSTNTINTDKPLIFQDFLSATKGRDLRCFVIGNQLVASMLRVAASGFKANVHQGGTVQSVTATDKLQNLSVKTSSICGLEICGVDLLLDSNTYRICEVNSSPGFEGLEKATSIDIAKAQIDYVCRYIDTDRLQRINNPIQPVKQMKYPVQTEHLAM